PPLLPPGGFTGSRARAPASVAVQTRRWAPGGPPAALRVPLPMSTPAHLCVCAPVYLSVQGRELALPSASASSPDVATCPRSLDCALKRRARCPPGAHACGPCLQPFQEDLQGLCVPRMRRPPGESRPQPRLEEEIDFLAQELARKEAGKEASHWSFTVLPLPKALQRLPEPASLGFSERGRGPEPGPSSTRGAPAPTPRGCGRTQRSPPPRHKEPPKEVDSASSDEENEDGDFTVYECPGLAPQPEALRVAARGRARRASGLCPALANPPSGLGSGALAAVGGWRAKQDWAGAGASAPWEGTEAAEPAGGPWLLLLLGRLATARGACGG
ncbi:neural proliferation differentiation and control protein 1, partial [Carlito syrichta]|uniref:Neural proliferation differentiation and control protein 1 n=1 Tax=Carlito syrichta TaxID=1868482 RepID=A0A3Q0DJN4_CARSF